MATLQQLMAQITGIQQRGINLVDPMTSMQQAQIALLAQLVAEVTALQGASSPVSAAPMPTDAQLEALIAPLVSEAVSAAFGKLEAAVAATTEQAQPAVAEENNTGSGAAPVAPSPASNSASLTLDAAGTAPDTQVAS